MSAPKHKKLTWKIAECKNCKKVIQESHVQYCLRQNHAVVPRPNEAFLVPELTFSNFTRTYSGTSRAVLKSPVTGMKYSMSMGDFEEVVPLLESGVLNKKCWFLWTRKSSRLGIKLIGEDE